jgi:hypothetical protein
METEPRMRKTGNPYYGDITKSCTVSGLIGFIYGNSVNNQLGREDKTMDFSPEPRKWGRRDGCLVRHKGKVYLEIKAQSSSTPVYRHGGEPIAYALVEPFIYKSGKPHTQAALDGEVVVRDVNICNIRAIRMLVKGNEYVVAEEIIDAEREVAQEEAAEPAVV